MTGWETDTPPGMHSVTNPVTTRVDIYGALTCTTQPHTHTHTHTHTYTHTHTHWHRSPLRTWHRLTLISWILKPHIHAFLFYAWWWACLTLGDGATVVKANSQSQLLKIAVMLKEERENKLPQQMNTRQVHQLPLPPLSRLILTFDVRRDLYLHFTWFDWAPALGSALKCNLFAWSLCCHSKFKLFLNWYCTQPKYIEPQWTMHAVTLCHWTPNLSPSGQAVPNWLFFSLKCVPKGSLIQKHTHTPFPNKPPLEMYSLAFNTSFHFTEWDALELWVIKDAYNQAQWTDIISGWKDGGKEITRFCREANGPQQWSNSVSDGRRMKVD